MPLPTIQTPSERLVEALQQYCEELEALTSSLDQVTTLLRILSKKHGEDHDRFVGQHGRNKRQENDSVFFTIDLEKRAEFQRIDRKLREVRSSLRLIPRNLLVALICTYDSFLGKLVRFILEVRPNILDESERTLTYSQLLSFSDVAAAREYLVEKEVESVLRKSHVEHFKWLEAKLKTPFNKGLSSWPKFVELTERRNLFVHCDGVVSSQYLAACIENRCEIPDGLSVGTRLEVNRAYFRDAYSCLYEIGVKMAHVIWRKLAKAELQEIDEKLISLTFALIDKGDYSIAINVLEFFTGNTIEHTDESRRRTMLINLAQAYKWSGNMESCLATLSGLDWSACEDRFKLAVSVLREQWEEALRFMRKLVHDENFHKLYYKEWPLFREFIKHEEFAACYRECYREEFAIEQQASKVNSAVSQNQDDQTEAPSVNGELGSNGAQDALGESPHA